MKRILALALASLGAAQAQLMNPPEFILNSSFFQGHQKAADGSYKKGFNTLKLTSKAGLVLKAEYTSNNTNLQTAAQLIAYLTGYGESFEEPVLNFLKQNQKELSRGVSVLDQDSQYNISVVQQSGLLGLSVERHQFPESTFPKNVPTYGDPKAKVAIRILSDYQCPYCQRLATTVLSSWKKQAGSLGIKIEHHHFPLSYHQNAFPAAEAAECANAQGKFWEFTDAAFQDWNWTKKPVPDALKDFSRMAGKLKLDTKKFDRCLATHQFKDRVNEGLKTGQAARLTGTPSVYVGGFKVVDYNNWKEMMTLIQLSQ
ncbi:DsbA family protein [Deinococcus cellulosilyticus]|nr:DsbA family protein [Deinococcus cellulosilyticus]